MSDAKKAGFVYIFLHLHAGPLSRAVTLVAGGLPSVLVSSVSSSEDQMSASMIGAAAREGGSHGGRSGASSDTRHGLFLNRLAR